MTIYDILDSIKGDKERLEIALKVLIEYLGQNGEEQERQPSSRQERN